MAKLMEVRMAEPGYILVAAAKDDAFMFLKKALHSYYKKLIHVKNINEAKQKASAENIFMMFVFSSASGDNSIEDYAELAVMKNLPAVFVVPEEIYPQAVYRSRGKRIFVLTYPMKRPMVTQAVNMMYETQTTLLKYIKEKDRLAEKLLEQKLVSRAKLIMVETMGMSEDEAHHVLERTAMNQGLTIKRAAENVIAGNENS